MLKGGFILQFPVRINWLYISLGLFFFKFAAWSNFGCLLAFTYYLFANTNQTLHKKNTKTSQTRADTLASTPGERICIYQPLLLLHLVFNMETQQGSGRVVG